MGYCGEKWRIILEEQDLDIETLENKLKELSSEYLDTLYKKGYYQKSMLEKGFFVLVEDEFEYGTEYEEVYDEYEVFLEQLRKNGIVAQLVNEDDYATKYDCFIIVLKNNQILSNAKIDIYLKKVYRKYLDMDSYEYCTGDFLEEINENGYFKLIENISGSFAQRLQQVLQRFDIKYEYHYQKLFEKDEDGILDNLKNNNDNDNKNNNSNNLNLSLDRLKEYDSFFENKLVGQKEAIEKIKEQLITSVYDISNKSNRPAGIFLFVGPTGVGKTEMTKLLSEFLYNNMNINRFDMSEYKSEVSIQKFIGAPNGYVGYEEGGTLVNAMKKNPNSVVLFDELEKAHPHAFDLFLQMFDEGIITSNKGEQISFNKNFIILTSNIGSNLITEDMTNDQSKKIIKDAINEYFSYELNRPEILGRIGKENIICFDPINKEEDQFKILDIHFSKWIKDIEKFNIKLSFNKEHVYKMILLDIDITKGARDIRNEFDQFKNHFNKAMFLNNLHWNDLKNKTLSFDYDNENVYININ